jgi:hypothetical protein
LLSVPANAAHVFTPISLSMLTPFIFAGRPIVNFTIPLFTSPLIRKSHSAARVRWNFSPVTIVNRKNLSAAGWLRESL